MIINKLIKLLDSNEKIREMIIDDFTYQSSAIEGSTVDKKGNTILSEIGKSVTLKEAIKIVSHNAKENDVIENIGCINLFKYVLHNIHENLSHELLWEYHKILKKDSNLAKNIPEEYGKYRKTHVGIVGSEFETAESHKIYLLLDELIKDFNYRRNIKLSDICEFHVRFESIHPYRDGNGRIGRMIMFKQCLENNIIPFVITKHSRNQYIDCLKIFNKQGEIKYLEKFIIKLQKDFREKYLNDDGKNMGKNEILIIKFLAKNNYASRKELEKYINLKERAMKILIKSMVIKKIISPVGKGKNTIYKLYS